MKEKKLIVLISAATILMVLVSCKHGPKDPAKSITVDPSQVTLSTKTTEAYVSAKEWKEAGMEVPVITYVGRDGTEYPESTTAPTEPGKYTAKITLGDATATQDYEL